MTSIISNQDIKNNPNIKMPVNYSGEEWAFYFQLVGIGPQSMEKNNFAPWEVPSQVPGYFISGNKEELKAFMHSLVDTAFGQLEKDNG